MNLRCSAHGLIPWLGQGECAIDAGGCGKLFKHLLQAPERCPNCSMRLLPYAKKDRVTSIFTARENALFTARPMCSKCFEGINHHAEADTLPDVIEEG